MADTKTKYDIDLDSYILDPPQQEDLDELLRVCRENLEEVDEDLVSRAFKLCYVSHEGIDRASGEPYYYHPVSVAKIVASEINIDDVSVVASLLHDTVEDTEVTLDDIKEKFGDTVSHLIDGVTKISGVFKSRNTKQAETFMKMLLSMAEDIRVVLIKFADRLHNMRTIQHLPREKQMQKASETMELYAPLAHRFGLFNIKSELEDLCFKVIDPNSYKFIARKLREKKEAREAFIEEFMDPIEEELDDQGFTFEMKGRPKHIYSIFRKMQRQQKPFEEIYDLFAIRIILEEPHTKEDCWRVYSIITDWYTPIPKRFRDFISVPKANGYQSLHTTVITKKGRKVEVQIRTRHMDDIAEKGVAAHWKYKEGKEGGSETLDKFVHWVRDVLDNPRPDAATEFVKDFQLNLYQDEIYVFTPDGELRTLPQGATPIDFAFDIHSEIGERAIAAKVNGKMAPLRQKLDIGDQVEIITGNKINLNPDWINDVVTHKAKSRIRQYIKQKERQTADEGREIWEKKAKRANIEISEQDLTRIAQKLKFDSTQDLFYDIGKGSFDVNELYDVVKQFTSKGRIEEKEDEDKPAPATEEEIQETYINAARSISDDKALVINGELTNVKYSYANCCNPIPGDDVMGFISRTGDVKVHRSNCKNIHHLIQTDGERIVDVSWAKNIDSKFLGAVKVVGEDRVGMINDITDVLSKSLETNMKSINVNSDSGMFEGILTVYVDDIDHLGRIINKLQKVGGVKSVFRYE
ncbi:bifunctional (p)ppGpp synthetase/guanosine-3',5'-bis(diphosphate) 3'-pyrophosphohydrolase [Fodinibius sp.]|uniref:RelA/SpoT family protein n=1 Tax=Fodinibius sp. TaxID=1872440 RepID=UPI002ACE1797|nr:bifunctional (p)ppGpp synthetase/guanosine-3',5'-bis(diphosphate) 3'-pyrophosphohydrolase [Fodinibius sp.]MDZ7657970.1 bifunctional (p)ppGpp synthetase/guanosine-3',5'-bis(diphosphate) 3'-pyrophosphohydrolase [Fodinibius sp.]